MKNQTIQQQVAALKTAHIAECSEWANALPLEKLESQIEQWRIDLKTQRYSSSPRYMTIPERLDLCVKILGERKLAAQKMVNEVFSEQAKRFYGGNA